MGAADLGVEKGGCGCPDLGPYLLGSGLVGHNLRVRDIGHDTEHWEGFRWIKPKVGLQYDGEVTSERTGHSIGLSPDRGRAGGGRIAGGGDLRLTLPEHSRTIYYYQAHY